MDDTFKLLIFLCLLLWNKVFAAPLQQHEVGGVEHVVIIDRNHPTPPHVQEVLERLALHENHPDVRHVYNNSAFRGFAASMKSHCLDKLAKMSDVSLVEEAVTVSTTSDNVPYSKSYDSRSNAPWGLQRISTASTVDGNAEALDYTYSFANTNLGAGADIYIVDTGIYTDNKVFGGRAQMLWSYDGDLADHDGHGTHVSGTAGGNLVGVASNSNIYGMKALGGKGGGWSTNIVAAIDKVVKAHDSRKGVHGFQGSVMSMSLEASGKVDSINSAISAATQAGVHAVVAAGNDDQDACQSSPASAGGLQGPAITVGAVDIQSQRASFSNFGNCVDVYAPGVSVISSWIGSPDMVNTLSGTSMATPHVTGIVAYAMANATLANDTGLMKEWVRMTALQMGNGVALANNGVQARNGSKDGLLGFGKIESTSELTEAHSPESDTPARKMRRSLSDIDPTMAACKRELELHGYSRRAAGLCNTKSKEIRDVRDIGDTVSTAIDQVHEAYAQ